MRDRGLALLLALVALVACRSTEHPSRSASSASSESGATAEPLPQPSASTPAAPPSRPPAEAAMASSSTEPVAAPRSAVKAPGGGKTSTAPVETETRAYRIAALGDSLTDPRSHGGGYLDYVLERCPESRVENFGKGGFMLNQIRRRFEREVLPQSKRFTHLVVFGGVNDLYSDLTAKRTNERIQRDLSAIYEQAKARGLEVVAITVAPWGGFKRYYNARRGQNTKALNAWIELQAESGVIDAVVDSYPLLSCGDPERLCADYEIFSKDGLHFNGRGHEVLGKALHEAVFQNCK